MVNNTPIAFVGRRFHNQEEAFAFLKESNFFKDKNEKALDELESGLEEGETSLAEVLMEYPDAPTADSLNYYNSHGFFVGYLVSGFDRSDKDEKFLNDVAHGKKKWLELFDEEGDYLLEVKVW